MSDTKQASTEGASTWLIITLLVCFFPIGLYLLWKHPEWSSFRKIAGTVTVFALAAFGNHISETKKAEVKAAIETADSEWKNEHLADACDTYRHVLSNEFYSVEKGELPRLFRRVIEFDADSGNLDQARITIELAKLHGISLSLESANALSLLATLEADTEADHESEPEPEAEKTIARSTDQSKLAALQQITRKLSDFPDRFAGDSERTQFNSEVEEMIKAFEKIPFDAVAAPDEARSIVELYEEKIQNRYSGFLFNVLHEDVALIMQDLLNR